MLGYVVTPDDPDAFSTMTFSCEPSPPPPVCTAMDKEVAITMSENGSPNPMFGGGFVTVAQGDKITFTLEPGNPDPATTASWALYNFESAFATESSGGVPAPLVPGGQLGTSLTYTAPTAGVLPIVYIFDSANDELPLNGNATMKITCTPPPTVTVTKVLSPAEDPGRFTLQVNGETTEQSTDVGDTGTTGPVPVEAGTEVKVTEIAANPDTDLANYDAELTCNTAEGAVTITDGSFQMPETDVTCTLTNTRKVAPSPPSAVTPVPTLSELGLMLMALAAGGLGASRLRRRG